MAVSPAGKCTWPGSDELMIRYHDEEWGVPLHDDQKIFEFMVLDAFQAGLSWKTILHKRENFRKAFANFNVRKVARFTEADLERLMLDAGIARNRLKIQATIKNAQCFMELQKEFGSFDAYIWQFTGGKPLVNKCKSSGDIPAKSAESDRMSKDLLGRGFKFVGSTICYAFMQAAGMVNDHLVTCERHRAVQKQA
ncbi:MAG: DNA-3-methyladenine glycosylase I [Sphingobacteriales bacterium]|nr:MAG: DNA-3-methyladenine glycosylase I [Sphingobacteriales bacterium]